MIYNPYKPCNNTRMVYLLLCARPGFVPLSGSVFPFSVSEAVGHGQAGSGFSLQKTGRKEDYC